MLTFRCTQKVRDLMGLSDRDLSEETDGDLEEWFVETVMIERYRCLLFTHKVSLYSFWALAVRKPDLMAFEEMFRFTDHHRPGEEGRVDLAAQLSHVQRFFVASRR